MFFYFVVSEICTTFAPQLDKRGTLSNLAERKLGYGVIGNTTDSGPVIPGSSPGIPTNKKEDFWKSKSLLFCLHPPPS